MKEIYEILEEALTVVEKGWAAYTRNDGHGNRCALGALDKVLEGQGFWHDWRAEKSCPAAVTALEQGVLPEQRAASPYDGADHPGPNVAFVSNLGKEEAIAMFQRAIRIEKERVAKSDPVVPDEVAEPALA